jgi:hypothetical protein
MLDVNEIVDKKNGDGIYAFPYSCRWMLNTDHKLGINNNDKRIIERNCQNVWTERL